MDTFSIEQLIHRIMSGYHTIQYGDQTFILYSPSIQIKQSADILYSKIYEDNLFSNFILQEDLDYLLYQYEILSPNYKNVLEQEQKKLDQSKIKLYQEFFDLKKRKLNKVNINSIQKQINKLYSLKSSYEFLTLEYYCNNIKNEYLICHTLYHDHTQELVFKNYPNIENNIFNDIANTITATIIDISKYKILAKSEYWKNIYNENKNNLFGVPAINLTDEQKYLINISSMYDRIYEHPECPDEQIIDDNDALDGWILYQKQQNKNKKTENSVSTMIGKHANKQEVFLMANNNEEQVQNILALNNAQGLASIKERTSLKEGAEIKETQLSDVRQRLRSELQQLNKR